jgi:hypothetical protein
LTALITSVINIRIPRARSISWRTDKERSSAIQPGSLQSKYVLPLLCNVRPDAKDEDLLKPSAIAEAFWYLVHQDRSAWSHELDVRPYKEKF